MEHQEQQRAFEQPQENDILHYGRSVLEGAPGVGSGRYPLGSGSEAYQHQKSLKSTVAELRSKGMADKDIAKHLQLGNTSDLRAALSKNKEEMHAYEVAFAKKLKARGMSTTAIAERMFKDKKKESHVRDLLKEGNGRHDKILEATTQALKDELEKNPYLDVGPGVELYLGVSQTRLKNALRNMESEGYKVHPTIRVEQYGKADSGQKTSIKVLTKDDISDREVYQHLNEIKPAGLYSEDGGETYRTFEPPRSIDPKKVFIRYAEDGGTDKDGVIELRRGVEELSLGKAHYAQVRIAVAGTHYLKGMAMYSDNIPEGYDIVFNTNKHVGTPMIQGKDGVLKKMKENKLTGEVDITNPFGAAIKSEKDLGLSKEIEDSKLLRQRHYIDKDGKEQLSAINIVNEEGDWYKWSHTISSQMLSKQPWALAKRQLDLTYQLRREQLNDILSLTNPTVKKKLLEGFANKCDSDAVDLKAYGFPGQVSKVILPVKELKDNECFCEQFPTGTPVVLIRHPHAGIFEIPSLVVNNRNKAAKDILGGAIDAIGINSKVASHLSGADFDGDTVIVIPNKDNDIKTKAQLEKLKDFDPKEEYAGYPGMKKMTPGLKQREMGIVSNLITDMTIAGAPTEDIVKAVRHSMVVIDAEKHGLDWKRSEKENDILTLKQKYQAHTDDDGFGGASTLISRAGSTTYRDQQRFKGYDKKTGEKIFEPTGRLTWKTELILKKAIGEKFGEEAANKFDRKAFLTSDNDIYSFARQYANDKKLYKTETSTQMDDTKDARTLISKYNTNTERVYANFANQMKAIAQEARKEMVDTPLLQRNPEARDIYAEEVKNLTTKLHNALRNKPLERQALIFANVKVKQDIANDPDLKANKGDLKKLKGRTLQRMREKTGAIKNRVHFTDDEWKAVQSGAVSDSFLKRLLDNADDDEVKQLAMPREKRGISDARKSLIRQMINNGYAYADVAKQLDISVSSVTNIAMEMR